MRRHFTRLLVLLWLTAGPLLSQNPTGNGTKAPPLKPDSGTLEKGVYTNAFFGFSYRPGDGWFVNEEALQSDKARGPKPPRTYYLLIADRRTNKPIRERILLIADDSSAYQSAMTLEKWVGRMAHALVKGSQTELLRDTYSVEYAGQHFYRVDYKENWSGGALYKAFTANEYKGFFLSWTFVANSKERLDKMVQSLDTLAFTHQQ